MPSLNRVIIMGNVTRDPEVSYTPKGNAVADLSLALNRTYKNSSGEKTEEVTFVDVCLWGRSAEVAGDYAKKGRAVLIEGRLHLETWDDRQTGKKRSRLRVVAENLTLIGGFEGGERPPSRPTPPPRQPVGAAASQGSFEDDDIPF